MVIKNNGPYAQLPQFTASYLPGIKLYHLKISPVNFQSLRNDNDKETLS